MGNCPSFSASATSNCPRTKPSLVPICDRVSSSPGLSATVAIFPTTCKRSAATIGLRCASFVIGAVVKSLSEISDPTGTDLATTNTVVCAVISFAAENDTKPPSSTAKTASNAPRRLTRRLAAAVRAGGAITGCVTVAAAPFNDVRLNASGGCLTSAL